MFKLIKKINRNRIFGDGITWLWTMVRKNEAIVPVHALAR